MRNFFIVILLVGQFVQGQSQDSHVVYFDTGQYDVPVIETNRLVLFIQELKDIEIERISIYGFTDDRGSDNYNLTLSQNRANAIKKVFSKFNIDDNLISNVDGKGEILLRVISSENLSIIRGLNRKVEINVEYQQEEEKIVDRKQETPQIFSKDIAVGDKITLENILFETGFSIIEKKSINVLEKLAAALLIRKDIYFLIQGHVCCTRNKRDAVDKKTGKRNLSMARAKFIYDYLIKKGVKRSRMKYIGLKNKYPLGGETKFDRRVEIKITYISERN
ncbi:MAG: OmpA family protein [Flavobacteriaceae bacterium]|nr:OmpA family protein [Flavobacteriaceae bacterium]